MNLHALTYILLGYLLGSILFAKLSFQLIKHDDITKYSDDHNPGTANAFVYGGFLCGILALLGDLLKGFIPIYLYIATSNNDFTTIGFALVFAAPVIGHIFSIFNQFQGGKGIAVSFGCLLGLIPNLTPLLILAGCFIFYSLVIKINPHLCRTLITYMSAMMLFCLTNCPPAISLGFIIVSLIIIFKLHTSNETRASFSMELLWKR